MKTYQYAPVPPGSIIIHDDANEEMAWQHIRPGDPGWDELQAQIDAGEITVVPVSRPDIYPQREQEEARTMLRFAPDDTTKIALLADLTLGVQF
jgi:hypothetical protein